MATRPSEKPASADAEGGNGRPEERGRADERTEAAVEEDLYRYIAPPVGPDDERVFTDSGIEVDRL